MTPARYPPPNLEDPAAAAGVRTGLASFLAASPERFARLFLRERPIRASRRERGLLRALETHGLVEHLALSIFRPRVRLVPFRGRFVAADLLARADPDQVFTPMFEQVYFVRNTGVRPDDEVLEIGVGSGILSLFAADRAPRVTATDRNPRALAFARFNLALNLPGHRVDLREGSLFEPLEPGRRFDLLIVNPPFEPTPPGETRFAHSDGGEDGLDVARACLAGAAARLRPGGRVEMITWSPGPQSPERALLLHLFAESLPGHGLEVHALDTWPIEDHLARFASCPGHEPWREGLRARGLSHLHFLFVRAAPGPAVGIVEPREEVARSHEIADAWLR